MGKTDPIYRVWWAMRDRCANKNNDAYADYGGRGITVCDRWNDFATFREDMGPRPSGYQIDRIDNDGNYEPSNCRWVTIAEQTRNRRSNIRVTFRDRQMCLKDACLLAGQPYRTIWMRIKRGTPAEIALAFGRYELRNGRVCRGGAKC